MAADGPSVLIVSDQFPPAKGGIGDYTALLADALLDQGVRASLFVPNGSDPAACRAPIAATFDRWSWATLSQLHRTLLATGAEWLHFQHNGGMYKSCRLAAYFLPRYLRWKRWPGNIAVTFHDINRAFLFYGAGVVRDWVLGDLARNADLVIAADTSDIATLQSLGSIVHQVPIGSNIPTSRMSPGDVIHFRSTYDIPPQAIALGHFGTALGLDSLFEVLARLPEAVLVLIGKTQEVSDIGGINTLLPSFHARIASLGVGSRIRWTSHLPDREVADVLAACDILVLPYPGGASLRHGGLMACLAQGRPVISTTPLKPTPGIVPGETFFAVAPGDVAGLESAVRSIATSLEVRRKFERGAGECRALFAWERIAGLHADLYSACPNHRICSG